MVASFFAACGVLAWTYLCLYTGVINSVVGTHFNHEIFWYICSFFIFVLVFVAVKAAENRSHGKYNRNSCFQKDKNCEICIEVVFGLCVAIAMTEVFLKEPLMTDAGGYFMPWHAGRRVEKILLILGAILALQYRGMLAKEGTISQKKSNYVCWYVLLAIAAGYATYHPNFLDSNYSVYHAHAYFNSVSRVLHLQPYNMLNSGVYGFYGIIQMPFVKMLGGDFFAFIRLMSVISAITVLCYCYVLDYVTKNSLLRVLGGVAIATPLISLSPRMYLQLWPHRIFMASLILSFMCFCKKHGLNSMKWKIVGGFLCTLSIVWNFETGLGCALAYTGGNIVSYLQKERSFKIVLAEAAKVILYTAAGWFLVSLYNLSVGGQFLTWKEFLFPLAGSNDYINEINISLSRIPSAWMLVSVLFLVVIAVVLGSTVWSRKAYRDDRLVIMAACVICASIQMLYYVNRAVWGNLFIVLPISGILLAGLVTHFSEKDIWKEAKPENGIKRVISVAAMLSLSAVTAMTATNYLYYEGIREERRDISTVKEAVKKIRKKVPRDTMAIGIGLPEIYSILGWKTQYYGIDMSDVGALDPESLQELKDTIMEEDTILLEDGALGGIMGKEIDTFYDEYEEQFQYSTCDMVYRLWDRKS